MRRKKQNAATLRVSLVVLRPPWGLPQPWVCNMPILNFYEVVENKKPFYMSGFYKWLFFVGGAQTGIARRTKQNAATLGVSVVVLGPLWGPPWPRVCDIPILDLNKVGENKKPFYMRIFLWEGHILALGGRQSEMLQP